MPFLRSDLPPPRSTRVRKLCVQIMKGSAERTMVNAARGIVPRVEEVRGLD